MVSPLFKNCLLFKHAKNISELLYLPGYSFMFKKDKVNCKQGKGEKKMVEKNVKKELAKKNRCQFATIPLGTRIHEESKGKRKQIERREVASFLGKGGCNE